MTQVINFPKTEGYYTATIVYNDGTIEKITVQAQIDSQQGMCVYEMSGYRLTNTDKKSITFKKNISLFNRR